MKDNQLKIGIALSGGGVRAAVFHLGVLARLADEDMLCNISMLSTVSGGTLITGLIYKTNNYKWPTSQEFSSICVPAIRLILTKKNIQLDAILRHLYNPWLLTKGRAKILSGSIQKCWRINEKISVIPDYPRWTINATTVETGKNFRFIPQKRMGDYIVNYVENPDISLADAMCSSASVPLLIGCLRMDTDNYEWFKYDKPEDGQAKRKYKPEFKKLHIWDGGVYDNLGVESLIDTTNNDFSFRKDTNFVIVSDASAPLHTKSRNTYFQKNIIDVATDQVRSLRCRMILDHFKKNLNSGVYIKIGNSVEKILNNRYVLCDDNIKKNLLKAEHLNEIELTRAKEYKTTLWKMKTKDFDILLQHGREAANATLLANSPELFKYYNRG